MRSADSAAVNLGSRAAASGSSPDWKGRPWRHCRTLSGRCANLVAGVIVLVLALLGVGARVMAWLPLPIIMGMFAGALLVERDPLIKLWSRGE